MIPLFQPKDSYFARRAKLLKELDPTRDLIVLFSSPLKERNYDNDFPYRGSSSFLYITGFAEPFAAALIFSENKKPRFDLFCQKRDPEREMWNGYRYGPERAKDLTGATHAFVYEELKTQILAWFAGRPAGTRPRVFSNAWECEENLDFMNRVMSAYNYGRARMQMPIESHHNLGEAIGTQRLIKNRSELKIMRQAGRINVEAHLKAMHATKPGKYEYEIQAAIEKHFKESGTMGVAYGSIVASGEGATILHYHENDRKMKTGDLLLIDAGCEHQFYASDITRTLPVSGKYSKPQRKIMDLVWEAHQEALRQIKVGKPFSELQKAATQCLVEGLLDLKILKGKKSAIIASGKHRPYYPHGVSHWLGSDTHDPCPYFDHKGQSTPLAPGMVFTIEPGLYFGADDKRVAKEYRGIGVRIENDVVVTEDGYEILTPDLPATAAEIEAEMKKIY